MLESIYWFLIGFVSFLLVFILIDRVCRCAEKCAMYKAMGQYLDKDILQKEMKKE